MNAPTGAPRTTSEMLASDLRSLAELANEAIFDVIGSRNEGEFELECFEDALCKLRSLQICLADHAEKLLVSEKPGGVQ